MFSSARLSTEARDDVALYVNARIVTMSPEQPAAEAMAVADGRILAIGEEAAVRAAVGETAELVNLGGATVVSERCGIRHRHPM